MKYLTILITIFITACSNDVTEEDKESHLFIIYGQSNAAGSGQVVDFTPVYGAEMWNPLQGYSQVLADPTRYDGEVYSSAWPSFANDYQAYTGEKVIILNAAFGGRKMSELKPGSRLNDRYIAWVEDALSYYESINENITKVSMIFVHGESDSGWGTGHEIYYNGVVEIADQLKDLTPLYDNIYITRTGLNRNPIHNNDRNLRFINLGHSQIENTKRRDDFIPVYIKSPTYTRENGLAEIDYIHYSISGNQKMGSEIAMNIVMFESGFDIKSALIQESADLTKVLINEFKDE